MSDQPLPTVAQVLNDNLIVINRGSSNGVKVGARFLIFGLGQEIVDPTSGQSLGKLEIVRGIGEVTHVQELMSTIRCANIEKRTPTRKITRRNPRSPQLFPIFGATEEEIIEEEQGPAERLPFVGVKVGDSARPL